MKKRQKTFYAICASRLDEEPPFIALTLAQARSNAREYRQLHRMPELHIYRYEYVETVKRKGGK